MKETLARPEETLKCGRRQVLGEKTQLPEDKIIVLREMKLVLWEEILVLGKETPLL